MKKSIAVKAAAVMLCQMFLLSQAGAEMSHYGNLRKMGRSGSDSIPDFSSGRVRYYNDNLIEIFLDIIRNSLVYTLDSIIFGVLSPSKQKRRYIKKLDAILSESKSCLRHGSWEDKRQFYFVLRTALNVPKEQRDAALAELRGLADAMRDSVRENLYQRPVEVNFAI